MKAKVKATGKIVDGIPIYYGSEGKGYLDVPVDHDIFDRYDLEEVELLEQPSLPEGLEEAAEEYEKERLSDYGYRGEWSGAFIAGAEWRDAQIPKLPDDVEDAARHWILSHNDGDVLYIMDAFKAGAEWMKAKMLEEAVECMVMDFSSNLPRPQVDILLDPGKYHTGDKVRVIVIKEDEK